MGSLPSDRDRANFEAQLQPVPLTRDGEAATSVFSSLSPHIQLARHTVLPAAEAIGSSQHPGDSDRVSVHTVP